MMFAKWIVLVLLFLYSVGCLPSEDSSESDDSDNAAFLQLLLARMRNLEKRMKIEIKIAKVQARHNCRRAINTKQATEREKTNTELLFEVNTLKMNNIKLATDVKQFEQLIHIVVRNNINGLQSRIDELEKSSEITTLALKHMNTTLDELVTETDITVYTDERMVEPVQTTVSVPTTTPETHGMTETRRKYNYDTVASLLGATNITVSLVDGPGPWEGRVELMYNNITMVTICDDTWNDMDARVVCTQLGYRGGVAFGRAKYGQGEGRIVMDTVTCNGTESRLTDCKLTPGESYCQHHEDAGVKCRRPLNIKDLTLTDYHIGRLEFAVTGTGNKTIYGTVCDDGFNQSSAAVVCRMLGYKDGDVIPNNNTYFGESNNTIILDDVACDGTEESLEECGYSEPFMTDCDHDEDVYIECVWPVPEDLVRNLTVTALNMTSVILSWEPPTSEVPVESYRVFYWSDHQLDWRRADVNVSLDHSFVLNDMTADTMYYFKVRAVDISYVRPATPTITFLTP